MSFLSGVEPEKLKIAQVIPVYKKGILPYLVIIGLFLYLASLISYFKS
jgi:hypothetical protein